MEIWKNESKHSWSVHLEKENYDTGAEVNRRARVPPSCSVSAHGEHSRFPCVLLILANSANIC